ncbi:MAG: glucose-6-phosphate isomerase, partial [Bdellovibrionota bacterium]
MSEKNSLSLHWNKANSVFPIEKHLENELNNLVQAKNDLLDKKGKSSEFTDWISFIKESAQATIEQQKPFVESISSHSDAIIVIGIGGSLLGTKAVYEALTHSFALSNAKEFHKKPLLFWAGHHLAQEELLELCEALESYTPSLVVISKSGGTTEPALAFRVLKQYLDNRFGIEAAQKRIFAITDPSNGTLLSISKKNHYPAFPIPQGIGGRYSIFTAVGLFPLALAGINVEEFVQGGLHAFEIFTSKENNSFT